MAINLQAMSRKELLDLQGQVEKALRNAEASERRAALKAAEKAAAEFGFSLNDLSGGGRTAGKRSKAPPKYCNPANPEQTWSGMGRKPKWIHEALAKGTDLSDLEI